MEIEKLKNNQWDSTLEELTVSCGKCVGCRNRKKAEWAVRMHHETMYHEVSCFVTLTYDDAHLDQDCSLDKRPFQLWLKRLRKLTGPFRYYLCGEYGTKTKRPHAHAILWGIDFSADRYFWRKTKQGYDCWRSDTLEKSWPHGQSEIGICDTGTVRYTAGYVTKKSGSPEHLERVDPITGEIWYVQPEFALMSRQPGIGRKYVDQYGYQVYDHALVRMDGMDYPVPQYYRKVLKECDPLRYQSMISMIQQKAEHFYETITDERLKQIECVKNAKLKVQTRDTVQ